MTDHKFEPFQQVLVRDGNSKLWRADFFSHNDGDGEFPFCCVCESWKQCIPYTPETAHLLGTSQPYEPPKPPQEYEFGDKVLVLEEDAWEKAVFIKYDAKNTDNPYKAYRVENGIVCVPPERIRPLPDSAAQ